MGKMEVRITQSQFEALTGMSRLKANILAGRVAPISCCTEAAAFRRARAELARDVEAFGVYVIPAPGRSGGMFAASRGGGEVCFVVVEG